MDEVLERVMDHNKDAAARIIDGEAFIITPHDNQIHNLTAVGTKVWQMGGEGLTIGEIIDRIVEEYDVEREEAERDVVAFVRDLEERQIITLKDTPQGEG